MACGEDCFDTPLSDVGKNCFFMYFLIMYDFLCDLKRKMNQHDNCSDNNCCLMSMIFLLFKWDELK